MTNQTAPSKHSYGYNPDKKDERDFKFQHAYRVSDLPTAVDLRNLCSPVRDQGDLGSCTGFSLAVGLREFLENKAKQKKPFGLLEKLSIFLMSFVKLSPLYVYYYERVLEGSVAEDAGAEIRDGIKVLAKQGCSPESYWPYIVSKFTKAPTSSANKSAGGYKISTYHRLMNLVDMKACLAGGNGFVLGFNVYDSFESDSVASTGVMPVPKPTEQLLGGHAVFCVGYQDDLKNSLWPGGGYLIIKNSWGDNWGDKGYFYMPYAFVTPSNVSDVWTAA